MLGFKIAIFTLNQWALDLIGNTDRIIQSIGKAHDAGAIYRAGPELEITGYSLEDAFFESDTLELCWECLKRILDYSKDLEIVVDVGMPIRFSSLYNCRVICYRGLVRCIRAKTSLAGEGIYREFRHFRPWPIDSGVTMFRLPIDNKGIDNVPFGANFVIELRDIHSVGSCGLTLGWEICQELWDIKNVSSDLYYDFGCHLVVNSSGSYWELRKLETMNDMIKGISLRSGACYAYSNLVGCDGQRFTFFGRSCIYEQGKLVNITPRDADIFEEIQMISHTIYPDKINEYRSQMGIRIDTSSNLSCKLRPELQSFHERTKHFILDIDIKKTSSKNSSKPLIVASRTSLYADINPKIPFQLEIHIYVSLWLWDYLRRSKMKGFMMPLSGGLDSSTVVMLVYSMCVQLYERRKSDAVRSYFFSCHGIPSLSVPEVLSSPEKICSILLRCRYIATQYSGQDTKLRAKRLAESVGADFNVISIQNLYNECRSLVGKEPGDAVELLDQNIQARLRMSMTYYMSDGNRIVLATGNVDEALMGYLTKYDCSSADINPIGGLCKSDLKSYLDYCGKEIYHDKPELVAILNEIIAAPPSAELTGADQRDEDEIGLTYDEISVLGRVRRGVLGCCGPSAAFETVWKNRENPTFKNHIRCFQSESNQRTSGQVARSLAELIKRFYSRYTRNRHKLTVLTPALHAESYSPDDNRFDHRQFLYPPLTMQYEAIDNMVSMIEATGDLS